MIPNTLFHWLTINERGRDFVVGDIHGHAALLDCLLDRVRFDPASDRLFALGDLIDRGPQSQLLLARVRDEPWFYSLRGNHEAMLGGALHDWSVARVWLGNGGEWGFGLPEGDHGRWAKVVDGLPLGMSLPLADGRHVGLVHAELHVRHAWDDLEQVVSLQDGDAVDVNSNTLQAAAMWGRSRIRALTTAFRPDALAKASQSGLAAIKAALQAVAGVDLIIAGHTVLAQHKPVVVSNLLFIDTGSYVPGGRLTMVEPLTGRYWQSHYQRNGAAALIGHGGQPLPAPAELPAAVRQA